MERAWLFGSRARREGHAESDLDIAWMAAEGQEFQPDGRSWRLLATELAYDAGLGQALPAVSPMQVPRRGAAIQNLPSSHSIPILEPQPV